MGTGMGKANFTHGLPMPFTTSYKKDDLKTLTIALSLSDKGTNSELLFCINNYFKVYSDLHNNSRFSGIFNKALGC